MVLSHTPRFAQVARQGGQNCSRRRLAPRCRGRLNKGRCALSGWNAPWRAQPHPPKPQPPLAARLIPANRPPGDCAPDGPTAVALRLPALRFGPPGGVYRPPLTVSSNVVSHEKRGNLALIVLNDTIRLYCFKSNLIAAVDSVWHLPWATFYVSKNQNRFVTLLVTFGELLQPGILMEPFAFSALRQAMDISVAQMATVLGLDGANASDRIREMERGTRPISGPALRVLSYLAQSVELGSEGSERFVSKALPRWLDCSDLEQDTGTTDIIMHTRWPRFFGWVADELPADLLAVLTAANIPVVKMDSALGLGYLVILFVDQPVGDTRSVVAEGVRLKEAQARRDLGL